MINLNVTHWRKNWGNKTFADDHYLTNNTIKYLYSAYFGDLASLDSVDLKIINLISENTALPRLNGFLKVL